MCGITGFVEGASGLVPLLDGLAGRGADSRDVLLGRMCSVIRHRGPDDEGRYVDRVAAIGMRRLSIIDLKSGHQPIPNEDGSIWTVFNGEIYNYLSLRRTLAGLGHQFRTASDTETIVHAYEEWGPEGFERLRGMFALALWDRRDGSLWLARDRAGIKPLYYAETPYGLFFGSEAKSILASGAVERALDPEALDYYLTFLYTPQDRSIFKGIRKLPPAHLLHWKDGRSRVSRYWRMPPPSFEGSEEEASEMLRAALADAVRCHLLSDVPIGAFLSGGIDSSAIVGLMSEVSGRRIRTFSIGFDQPEFDELEHARSVARHFGTDHHEFVVKPDAASILDDLVWHFDEPFGDASAIPTWYVSRIAREHVKVVLSGDGGDELFGGYDRYVPHRLVQRFDRFSFPFARRMAGVAWPLLPRGIRGRNLLRHAAKDPPGRYVDSLSFFHSDERMALLSGDLAAMLPPRGPEHSLLERMQLSDNLAWPLRMMRLDFETYLPEDVLTKVDRMSMAHSLETRVPLLDNEVLSVAASLPAHFMIAGGERKRVFKRALSKMLPASVLARRKQGFGVPVGQWFRGPLAETFGDILLAPATAQRGYFKERFVSIILTEHLSGRRDHTLRLWLLLVFEMWNRRYLDRPAVEERLTAARRAAIQVK